MTWAAPSPSDEERRRRVCARRRAPALAILAWAARVALAGPEATAPERAVTGWRTDTTGNYPQATPPLHWSDKTNAAWTTPMPGESAATPVLAGDRVFVLADPFWLLCVGKADGRVLWRKSNAIGDVIPPGGMDEYRGRCLEWFDASEKRLELELEQLALRRAMAEQPADPPESLRRLEEIAAAMEKLQARVAVLPAYASESKKGGWNIGFTCCTPVCDGRVLFALFGNGVGALYDLDGNLRWARFLRHRLKGYGQSSSPALAGGTVGVHIDDDFFALDLETGRTRWVEYELQHQGSPVGIRVGETDYFITNDGNVRVATNGVVAARLGLMRFHTPVVLPGNRVWYIHDDRSLVGTALEPDGRGGLRKRSLGGGPAPGKIYWSSPLIHGDLAYLWEGEQNLLSIVELASGKLVAQLPYGLGAAYVSPTGAGRFVFVSGAGGGTVVIENGWRTVELGPGVTKQVREFKAAAQNQLDPFWACPVFEGDRMYLRTFRNLYCFRASAEDLRIGAPPAPAPQAETTPVDDLEKALAP